QVGPPIENQAVTNQIVAAFIFEVRNLFGTLIFRYTFFTNGSLDSVLTLPFYNCQLSLAKETLTEDSRNNTIARVLGHKCMQVEN
ncbi:MAG: hypothetical protein NC221_08660, partial [Duncaniella sp.]|nr:hypothetical protein [Duncaniella sp.]